ncbi:MAG: site-2 protease family protein [Clostridiales bacterium]|jgi:Zn-dependent protease|nr:site-2 protease family protein [Clostridiales bacterium]
MVILMHYAALIVSGFIAVQIHEIARGAATVALGDNSPKRNRAFGVKLRHVDLLGLFCIVMCGGLGWSNPVGTTPMFYRNRKRGVIIANMIPLVANMLVGCGVAFAMRFISPSFTLKYSYIIIAMWTFCTVNISFALFNLIPVYPLDGSAVMDVILSPNACVTYSRYEKTLQIVLILLLLFGLIGRIISPVASTIFINLAGMSSVY